MKVRWTLDAVDDLTNISDYIADRNPEAGRMVVQ